MLEGSFDLDIQSLGLPGIKLITQTRIVFDSNGGVEYLQKHNGSNWQSVGKGIYYQDLKRVSINMGDESALYDYETLGNLLAMRLILPTTILKKNN